MPRSSLTSSAQHSSADALNGTSTSTGQTLICWRLRNIGRSCNSLCLALLKREAK